MELSIQMTENGECKEGSKLHTYNNGETNFRKIDGRSLSNFNHLSLLVNIDSD